MSVKLPICALSFGLLVPAMLCAHPGEVLQPHDLWSSWELRPTIIIPLLLLALGYTVGARASRGFRLWEQYAFWLGWLTLAIALVSPLHPLGEALFSAHMVQHELLMTVSAPLLVLGRPLIALFWLVPLSTRRAYGVWRQRPTPAFFANLVQSKSATWLLHAVVLWVWHVPALFNRTLTSDLSHSLQHTSFLTAALLYWWPLTEVLQSRDYGFSVLSLFATAIHTVLLGALLTLAPSVLYTAYGNRPITWGLTPLEDQQLGGLIMWVPAGMVYVGAALALTYLWLRRSDRELSTDVPSLEERAKSTV